LPDVVDAFLIWKEEGRDDYLRKVFIPVERAVQSLPKVWIRDSAVDAVCRGAPLAAPGVVKLEDGIRVGDTIAIMSLKGELVAIGEAAMPSDRILAAKSGIVARPRHVVMDPGVYPKGWKSG
ncbi:MAG: PUA domain-containing protein, partial [Thermofilaceae archaeon]